MTKEEFEIQSIEWKQGWFDFINGKDINMSQEEINAHSEDWKIGLLAAAIESIQYAPIIPM